MSHYQLYALTFDGHVRSADDIEANDDGEAVQLTLLRLEQADVELWCGKRMVALVPGNDWAMPLPSTASASEPRHP